jgi:hypothetical protein
VILDVASVKGIGAAERELSCRVSCISREGLATAMGRQKRSGLEQYSPHV